MADKFSFVFKMNKPRGMHWQIPVHDAGGRGGGGQIAMLINLFPDVITSDIDEFHSTED